MDIKYKCEKCGNQTYLYKELLENGKAIICCNKIGCNWRSEPVDHHKDIQLLNEIKKDWQ